MRVLKWSHMHSVGTGTIAGIYIAGHIWSALAIALTLGIGIGRAWHGLKRAGTATTGLLAARVATERERRANLRASRRVKLDKARASRAALERAYVRGVIEGRLDSQR